MWAEKRLHQSPDWWETLQTPPLKLWESVNRRGTASTVPLGIKQVTVGYPLCQNVGLCSLSAARHRNLPRVSRAQAFQLHSCHFTTCCKWGVTSALWGRETNKEIGQSLMKIGCFSKAWVPDFQLTKIFLTACVQVWFVSLKSEWYRWRDLSVAGTGHRLENTKSKPST